MTMARCIQVWVPFFRFSLVLLWMTVLLTNYSCDALQPLSSSNNNNNNIPEPETTKLKAAVLVPGFLTGADEFRCLCDALTERGLPTVAVPMKNWHWLPCIGGRSVRPMLERIDFTVQHLIANDGDVTKIPNFEYSLCDLWKDFWTNPGGVAKVGGSDRVDEYPLNVEPQGKFVLPSPEKMPSNTKVALIGHSAGGWISRAYLSNRSYGPGGKVYNGSRFVHSLVTLGTPHESAPGVAFEGIKWCNQEGSSINNDVRSLAVGGTGFDGDKWGTLTLSSYSFCCPTGSDGSSYTGDGMTPIQSALAFPGAETMTISNVTHFRWDSFGGSFVAPELAKDYQEGRPWYGSKGVVEKWADWIISSI